MQKKATDSAADLKAKAASAKARVQGKIDQAKAAKAAAKADPVGYLAKKTGMPPEQEQKLRDMKEKGDEAWAKKKESEAWAKEKFGGVKDKLEVVKGQAIQGAATGLVEVGRGEVVEDARVKAAVRRALRGRGKIPLSAFEFSSTMPLAKRKRIRDLYEERLIAAMEKRARRAVRRGPRGTMIARSAFAMPGLPPMPGGLPGMPGTGGMPGGMPPGMPGGMPGAGGAQSLQMAKMKAQAGGHVLKANAKIQDVRSKMTKENAAAQFRKMREKIKSMDPREMYRKQQAARAAALKRRQDKLAEKFAKMSTAEKDRYMAKMFCASEIVKRSECPPVSKLLDTAGIPDPPKECQLEDPPPVIKKDGEGGGGAAAGEGGAAGAGAPAGRDAGAAAGGAASETAGTAGATPPKTSELALSSFADDASAAGAGPAAAGTGDAAGGGAPGGAPAEGAGDEDPDAGAPAGGDGSKPTDPEANPTDMADRAEIPVRDLETIFRAANKKNEKLINDNTPLYVRCREARPVPPDEEPETATAKFFNFGSITLDTGKLKEAGRNVKNVLSKAGKEAKKVAVAATGPVGQMAVDAAEFMFYEYSLPSLSPPHARGIHRCGVSRLWRVVGMGGSFSGSACADRDQMRDGILDL